MPEIGRRYDCTTCGTAVLCLRPAERDYECCSQPMGELEMEQLPSGD